MNKEQLKQIIILNKIPLGVCSLILGFNFIFYLGFIGYQEGKIEDLQESYSKIRNYKHNAQHNEENHYLKVREDLRNFDNQIVPVSSFVKIVSDLKNKFQRSDVMVSKMTFKPDQLKDQALWKYTTSFTLSGEYKTLKRILADIQNSPNLYCIDRFAFYNDSDTSEKVELSLSITTYYNGKS